MKAVSSLSLMLLLSISLAPTAQAQPSNLSIKTGYGDEITIKKGLFGNKTKVFKDRLGDSYESSTGLLGNTTHQVGILGNSYSKKKGIFGTREYEAHTMLGDSIKTKKSWFLGRRTTTVDASGMTSLIGAAFGKATKKNLPPAVQPNGLGSDISSFGSHMAGDLSNANPNPNPPPINAMPGDPGVNFPPPDQPVYPAGAGSPQY